MAIAGLNGVPRGSCWRGGRVMVKRVTGLAGAGFRIQAARPTITHATKPAVAHTDRFRQFVRAGLGGAAETAACDPVSAIHFNSRQRSLVACHRSSGSFAKHLLTTRSSAGGVIGWREDMGGGSSFRIAPITLAWLLPSNALLPVAISYTKAPNAKTSVRASTSLASSCSGAMYCSVPRIVPACVTASLAVAVGS